MNLLRRTMEILGLVTANTKGQKARLAQRHWNIRQNRARHLLFEHVEERCLLTGSPWHNTALSADVDNDGLVVAMDAHIIIEMLNANGNNPIPVPTNGSGPQYPDVNDDFWVSQGDVDAVNFVLNSGGGGGPSSAPPPPALPTVSIHRVIDANEVSASDPDLPTVPYFPRGQFKLSRTGSTTETLAVTLTRTGTATNGVDYAQISTTWTIPAGSESVLIDVNPIDDHRVEGTEQVSLAVEQSANYGTGVASAEVKIFDNDFWAWRDSNADQTNPEGEPFDFYVNFEEVPGFSYDPFRPAKLVARGTAESTSKSGLHADFWGSFIVPGIFQNSEHPFDQSLDLELAFDEITGKIRVASHSLPEGLVENLPLRSVIASDISIPFDPDAAQQRASIDLNFVVAVKNTISTRFEALAEASDGEIKGGLKIIGGQELENGITRQAGDQLDFWLDIRERSIAEMFP